MQKIRVLVANRPRLMRDLVLATISEQPDIEVLGELEDDSKIIEAVEETQPDFVIIALDRPNERPAICDNLLGHHPRVKVLALAAGQDNSVFFWSDIQSTPIESSEQGILNVIRGKTKPRFQHVM
ncbi:MAG: response regulator transcription factor [Acidobacteria bacterium]|nr:response regulator transcription factor [Acidobacteriota bacterium]MBV9625906.1 response regulator transcription factor [Acidobacteriota bacterium]